MPPAVRQQRLQTGPALEGDFTFTGSASNAWKATRRFKGTVQKGTVAPGRATVPQCRSGSGDTARGVRAGATAPPPGTEGKPAPPVVAAPKKEEKGKVVAGRSKNREAKRAKAKADRERGENHD